jgi:hypothetical protein
MMQGSHWHSEQRKKRYVDPSSPPARGENERSMPADWAGGATSALIKIKSAALASRYAGKRGINFSDELGRKMTRGDKLALVGVTVGWLIAGALMTSTIYAFMVYVLKYP